jgi:hypothetical protein
MKKLSCPVGAENWFHDQPQVAQDWGCTLAENKHSKKFNRQQMQSLSGTETVLDPFADRMSQAATRFLYGHQFQWQGAEPFSDSLHLGDLEKSVLREEVCTLRWWRIQPGSLKNHHRHHIRFKKVVPYSH